MGSAGWRVAASPWMTTEEEEEDDDDLRGEEGWSFSLERARVRFMGDI